MWFCGKIYWLTNTTSSKYSLVFDLQLSCLFRLVIAKIAEHVVFLLDLTTSNKMLLRVLFVFNKINSFIGDTSLKIVGIDTIGIDIRDRREGILSCVCHSPRISFSLVI